MGKIRTGLHLNLQMKIKR